MTKHIRMPHTVHTHTSRDNPAGQQTALVDKQMPLAQQAMQSQRSQSDADIPESFPTSYLRDGE